MRPLRALMIYLAAVFVGGALLAPWLYWLAQDFAGAFPRLAAAPFHRFLDRSLLILALGGLWPLWRALGAVSLSEVGIVSPQGQEKKIFAGLMLGLASLLGVAAVALVAGGRCWRPAGVSAILRVVCNGLVSAVVVACLEEILFRGGIFGGLRRTLGWRPALAISSAVYALLHFLRSADLSGSVAWNSGLILLPQMLAGFVDVHALAPGFLTLTLAGALLALAYQRTGNLYFSIGLHAGWVWVLKLYGALTAPAPEAEVWFWGTARMFDGWLAFLAVAILLAGSRGLIPREQRDATTAAVSRSPNRPNPS